MAYLESALYVDSVAWTAVAQWQATHAYTVGQIVRQLAAPAANSERCFLCIVAGTSLSSEPAWVLSRGAKTTESGGPTWMECTGLPALCADNTNTNRWAASAGGIALGWIIKNVANDHYFICTTAGTGGTGAEPAWSTTTGATTTDGSVTWTCIGATSSFTTKWGAAHARLTRPLDNSTGWLVNAGMTVYVGDDHSEAIASTATPAFNCSILCVDHTVALPAGASNLKTTAALTFTTSSFWNNTAISGYVYGLQFLNVGVTNPSWFNLAGTAHVIAEQCLLSSTGGGGLLIGDSNNVGGIIEFKSCSFVGGNSTIRLGCAIRWENCSVSGFAGSGTSAELFSGNSTFGNFLAEGCDLTGIAGGVALVGGTAFGQPYGYMLFKDCKIPSGVTVFRGGDAGMGPLTIDLNRCDSGGTNYRNERHSQYGTLTTSTSVIRTGGSKDGATSISHQVATTANALFPYQAFNNVPLTIWNAVTGSNRNVTVYGIVNDSRVPNNDEVWFDVEYLGSASTPQGSYARGSKANVLATGTALTADTSAWGSAATARANTTAYTVGQVIKTASNPGRAFWCITAGTSAGSEPGGYATAADGGSVTDGGATFRAGCRFSQTITLGTLGPATTWNPADMNSSTLSNGNLTVSGGYGVRSTNGLSSGKVYFEMSWASPIGSTTDGCGILSPGASFVNYKGNGLGGLIVFSDGPIYYNGGATGINIGAVGNGNKHCFAVDLGNKRLWVRINGGNWNGNATYDPVANVGGIDISSLFPGNLMYASYGAGLNGSSVTANFGATSFAQTVPSGYSAWNSLILASPQPGQPGYLYAYPRIGRPSMTYYLDPLPVLS